MKEIEQDTMDSWLEIPDDVVGQTEQKTEGQHNLVSLRLHSLNSPVISPVTSQT